MDAAPADHPRAEGLLTLAVVAGVFLVQLPFRLHGLNLIDEGAIFQIGEDLLAGHRLYADIVHPAFPGIHWAMAATFWFFGSTFDSARTFGVALFAVTAGALFVMGRWFLSRREAFGLVVLVLAYRVWAYPHWHMVSYSSLGVGLVLVATAVAGAGIDRPGWWRFAVAGVLAGLGVLAKQDIGPLGIVTLALAIVVSRPREAGTWRAPLGAFAIGITIVGVTSLGYILWTGTFVDLVERTIVGPLHGLQSFPYRGRPPLRPLFAQSPAIRDNLFSYAPTIVLDLWWRELPATPLYRDTWAPDLALKVVYYLPIAVLAAGVLVVLARRVRVGRPATAGAARFELLVWTACAFLLAFNRPRDWIHLLVLYPPTLVLGAVLVAQFAHWLPRGRRVVGGMAATGLAVAITVSGLMAMRFLHTTDTPLVTSHGTMYAPRAQASSLQALVDALHATTPVDAPMIAFPYHPLLHYLGDRPRVPPYPHVWPVDADPRREADIIAAIDRHPDTLVVYTPTQFPHFARFPEFAPQLHAHLVRHFTVARVFGGDPDGYTFLLLRRRTPQASTSLLGALTAAPVTVTPVGPGGRVPPLATTPLVADEAWPFARVLRTPLVPDVTVTVTLPVHAAAGERLALGYGFNPDHWLHYPYPHARFVVAMKADGDEQVLADTDVFPYAHPQDRRWIPLDVDLGPWVGRPAVLELRVTGISGGAPRFDVAGFAEPRILGPAAMP